MDTATFQVFLSDVLALPVGTVFILGDASGALERLLPQKRRHTRAR